MRTSFFYEINGHVFEVVLEDDAVVLIKPAERVAQFAELSSLQTKVKSELDEYFQGKRKKFALNFEFSTGSEFDQAVWQELLKIEYGKTVSYSEIARKIGKPSAARAAGNAVGRNPIPIIIPCHRVVSSDGSIGGFSLGVELKTFLLEHEARFAV